LAVEAVRAATREIHPDHVISGAETTQQGSGHSPGRNRFAMFLLAVFAGLVLLVSSVGSYCVTSCSVAQQIDEIAIRMVPGKQRRDAVRLVLRRAAAMALRGIAIGVAAAYALTRLMAHLLCVASATDPRPFAAVAIGVMAIALAACYLSAHRATQIDPMTAFAPTERSAGVRPED
jgi:ABC-type antimicrobial peptide transport system permease subunit